MVNTWFDIFRSRPPLLQEKIYRCLERPRGHLAARVLMNPFSELAGLPVGLKVCHGPPCLCEQINIYICSLPNVNDTGGMKTENQFFTVNDAARLLQLSPDSVRAFERAGKLPALRASNGTRLFKRRDIERLVAERAARKTGAK